MRTALRIAALAALVLALAPPPAAAQPAMSADVLPEELEGADITEKLGDQVPLDLLFRDEHGRPIELSAVLDGDLPVLLTFNYSTCPMLCSVQLGGLLDTLAGMTWRAGEQFRILTVGLDPKERPEQTRATKERYLERYDAPKAAEGWRFVTGSDRAVRALADAVGYGYRYHPSRKEYAHPAAVVVLSPSGMVARYLYGVAYEPEDVRNSLISAALGRPEESAAKFILSCFHWEPKRGFAATAVRVMNVAAGSFALGVAGVLGVVWIRRRRRDRHPVPNHPSDL
jgi:protein SCO1